MYNPGCYPGLGASALSGRAGNRNSGHSLKPAIIDSGRPGIELPVILLSQQSLIQGVPGIELPVILLSQQSLIQGVPGIYTNL